MNRGMRIKFSIADCFWAMTAVAILFAMLRIGGGRFLTAFILLNLLQIILPIGILFATIVFADQRGPMLDHATVPGWPVLKRIWLLSMMCTVVVWALLLGAFYWSF
jgi:hypothetical protein